MLAFSAGIFRFLRIKFGAIAENMNYCILGIRRSGIRETIGFRREFFDFGELNSERLAEFEIFIALVQFAQNMFLWGKPNRRRTECFGQTA